jgi:GntR family transcriptional regulator, transcriptional repressor for pyruvate dehydrogenase complex
MSDPTSQPGRTKAVTGIASAVVPTKLTRRTLAETLLGQLRQQILTGNLQPGAQLPTEKALCEAYGVGRTTVREALQGLLAGGLVRRQGTRLIVVDKSSLPREGLDDAVNVARLSLDAIFETRKLIEVECARLAALRHTKADVAKLRRLLQQMDPADRVSYHMRHQQFHLAIVQMSGNEVLARVFERSTDILFRPPSHWRLFASRADGAMQPLAGGGREGHEGIITAVAGGSAAEAAHTMYEHLDGVEKVLISRMEAMPEELQPVSGTAHAAS